MNGIERDSTPVLGPESLWPNIFIFSNNNGCPQSDQAFSFFQTERMRKGFGMKKNRLCEILGIKYPIIQAPMNWITGASLAAAVSNAGGLGVIGPNAGYRKVTRSVTETGERLRKEISRFRSCSKKPFGVNLIAPEASIVFPDEVEDSEGFSNECLRILLEEKIPAVVLTGEARESFVKPLKEAGIKILYRGMPINIEIAKKAESTGVDAIVAVGVEGGGHTGRDYLSTLVLVPQISDAVGIPVVAGGGIADGRGLLAAFALGAEGIFMGTRFIGSMECDAHDAVKEAIIRAEDTSTATVEGLPGVLRALRTPIIDHCEKMKSSGCSLKEISDRYDKGYTKGMLEGDMAEGTFVCGAAAGLIKEIKGAGDLIEDVLKEADQGFERIREVYLSSMP